MNIVMAIYIVAGVIICFTMVCLIIIIAGKDILYAFKRRFMFRGADVFIANSERNISHYYMVPKENKFMIRDFLYITNPKKTMNYNDIDRVRIIDSILNKEKRINAKIEELRAKCKMIVEMIAKTQDEKQKLKLESQLNHFEKIIKETEDLKRIKEENYFNLKRPAFFYIEGDPIPKDFYEWYSTLDGKIIDNMVTRRISDPQNKQQEKDFQMMKWIIIGAGIASAVAAIMALRNSTALMELCRNAGIQCGGL